MLTETLELLAATGGTALVSAAATDAWQTTRSGFTRLLGRGNPQAEQTAAGRLDRLAAQLGRAANPQEQGAVRRALEAEWCGRLKDLLEEQPEMAAELGELIARIQGELPAAQQTYVQNNTAYGGGIQNITQGGDIIVGDPARRQR
ncbi:hypothetical protein [Streptomyces sp. NBC_01296]|uniref:hypothetical protein n=1 Tax=Streptomyces sp. NBC_01296 TaxID=2903816 RepID=UPI002E0E14C5|nr:hypothetical protein OG299_17620 [Streptomyces sp. NBC_01296]